MSLSFSTQNLEYELCWLESTETVIMYVSGVLTGCLHFAVYLQYVTLFHIQNLRAELCWLESAETMIRVSSRCLDTVLTLCSVSTLCHFLSLYKIYSTKIYWLSNAEKVISVCSRCFDRDIHFAVYLPYVILFQYTKSEY